jgi:hypothetical protein
MNVDTQRTHDDSRPYAATRGDLSIPRSGLIAAGVLAIAALLRSILASWSANQGFVEYNADGFSRVIRGYEWLQAPRWEVELWLPLHFWFYGAALWIWNDVLLVPRMLNFTLGVLIIVGFYLIGSTLVDRRAGVLAALLVAVFPYEVWLSMSGMSEPLFHALIVGGLFGTVLWWRNGSQRALLAGGIALAAATAVRYEAWFFVAVFIPVVLGASVFRGGSSLRYAGASVVVSISFMMLWIQQNWQVHGDALAFARGTEAAKIAEDPSNIGTGLWERVIYFPETALITAPGLILFGAIASATLVLLDRKRWWPLLAMIWGQAVLLVVVTSAFASQGPGAERYMLINTILLCLPIAGLAAMLIDRCGRIGTLLSGVIVLTILMSFVPDWLNPPDHYPATDTQSLAGELEARLSGDREAYAVVLLPRIPDERFNEGYALRVLSGYPDRVEVTDEPSRLYEATQQGEASLWIIDERVDVNEPPAEERLIVGEYVIGFPPPPATASTERNQLSPGEAVTIDGADFQPGETISTWWTAPNGDVYAGPELVAGEDGSLTDLIVSLPDLAVDGRWALTLAGRESQRQAFVGVEVVE